MERSIRKILIIGSASILSLGLVLGIWILGGKSRTEVYSSSEKSGVLTADFRPQPKKNLDEWEKRILDRNTPNTGSSNLNGLSYTDSLTGEILGEYFRAKQLNMKVDEEKLVEKMLAENLPGEHKIEYKQYKTSDLKLTPVNDNQSLKNYGNSLGEAAAENVYDTTWGNEFEILTRAMELNNKKELEKLDPIIENYHSFISDLLKIEVPSEVAVFHLNIINSLSKIHSSVIGLKTFLDDPFKGLFTMTSYAKFTSELQDEMKKLNQYMKNNNIVFTENEPGFSIERSAGISLENNE